MLRLHAEDCDEGLNSRIQYAVDKDSYFAVNSSTGVVSVLRGLHSSANREHVLQVTGDGKNVGGIIIVFIQQLTNRNHNKLPRRTAYKTGTQARTTRPKQQGGSSYLLYRAAEAPAAA